MKECLVDVPFVVVLNYQMAEVFQTSIGSLDFPAFAIAAQGESVLGCGTNPSGFVRHDQLDSPFPQLFP